MLMGVVLMLKMRMRMRMRMRMKMLEMSTNLTDRFRRREEWMLILFQNTHVWWRDFQ